jgi:hypothetical protein
LPLVLFNRHCHKRNLPASTIREIVEEKLPGPRNKIEIVKTPGYIE